MEAAWCFAIVTPQTAELMQWLSEEEEQSDLSSDFLLPIESFGPDMEQADTDLLEALSELGAPVLFSNRPH
jgi:hypothetical protein